MSRLGCACYLNAIETQQSEPTRKIGFILSTIKLLNKESLVPWSMAGALLFIRRAVANDGSARSTESLIESVPSFISTSWGNYINGLLGNDLKLNFMWDTLVGILYILGSEPSFGLQDPHVKWPACILLIS
jgi:hypothetical protein